MRKIILEEWLSLDGFAADKNNALDFFPSTEANKFSDEDQLKFLESVDLILLGRKTYELFVDFWPQATIDKEIIADKLNLLPKVIVSQTLKDAPWGKWKKAEVLSGDLIPEIKKLKAQNGKDIVLWGSISIARALIQENLIDEYHIQICPTVLGEGKKLFPTSDQYTNLKLVEVRNYPTGVVFLKYENK
ncbi:dihydrofolate reductase family protein [Flavobacterium silvaticum]|uniref:Dihydrofolate reductase family protein n=1 Tax=Flavobacterium silvaticum TaxID=1852020 RepID=A0A972FNZ1_9FLAO|nr:dihydrofolate reductase family protein [Flavobacterium silvaticum]NMH29536.1 dihydrofolate reductase family protein [Flavobacterium silvaticum]